MRYGRLLLSFLAVVLVGCVPSLHRLYSDETVVFDERLIGGWTQDDNGDISWRFTKSGEDSYELVIREDDKSGEFDVHLVNLDGQLYMDMFPGDLKCDDMVDLYKIHLLPAHTFMKVTFKESQVLLQILNPSTFEKILDKDPGAVRHEKLEEAKGIVMTAPTKQLQEFMMKYSGREDFFGDPIKLHKGPSFSTKDVIFEPGLVGTWSNDNGTMVLSSVDDKYYKIEHKTDDEKKEYSAVLVKTRGRMFWAVFMGSIDKDILLDKTIWPDMVAVVENIQPRLQIRPIESGRAGDVLKLNDRELNEAISGMDLMEMNAVGKN